MLIEVSRDSVSDWLDQQKGHTVTDNSIFANLPRHWEAEYHRDMDALNVSVCVNRIEGVRFIGGPKRITNLFLEFKNIYNHI